MQALRERTVLRNITPSREETIQYFQHGNLVPVYHTMLADLETPVSVYMKLRQLGDVAFLLESVEGGEQVSRYSFLGVNPKAVLSIRGSKISYTEDETEVNWELSPGQDPLDVVQAELNKVQPITLEGLPRFVGGAVGYIGYDVVRHFEKLPTTASDDLDMPDMVFLIPDTLVIFDHAKHQLLILANAYNQGDGDEAYDSALETIQVIREALKQPLIHHEEITTPLSDELSSNMTREEFEDNVQQAKAYISAGDAFQIVLSQRFTRQTSAEPLTIYRALRALNPSPYMFFFEFGNTLGTDELINLVGASPEMMVRYEDGIATVRPIAGTRPRGRDEVEDQRLAEELLADQKERAEHVMLIDLGRNDIGRVSEYGSVKVPTIMTIELYSHVMHIVSQVQGKLKEGLSAFDVFRATFPAGTLSGAPKIRAMEIIEELEGTRRGIYGGAIGYFSYDGSMDTCIAIRAMVMKGDQVYIQAGAGIVADSDPATEYEETVNKAMAVAVAIQHAEEGLG